MKTLIVWQDGVSTHLYAIPSKEAVDYLGCNGSIVGAAVLNDDVTIVATIQHLGFLLGEEPWFKEGDPPSLGDFVASFENRPRVGESVRDNAYDPPLRKYLVEGVAGKGIEVHGQFDYVVLTGWLV